MPIYRRVETGRRGPGFTRCPKCGGITDNAELVMIARKDKTKGPRVCPACADRLAGVDNG